MTKQKPTIKTVPLSPEMESLYDPEIKNSCETICEKEKYNIIFESFSVLKPREAVVISLYFGFENDRTYTLKQLSRIFKICPERVRQVLAKGLRKLKNEVKLRNALENIYFPRNGISVSENTLNTLTLC